MNKKLLLAAAAACMVTSASAYAVNVELNVGAPGYYAAPAPVYVAPPSPVYVAPYPGYYDPHHRNRDWRYWQERHRWEHDHPGGHYSR